MEEFYIMEQFFRTQYTSDHGLAEHTYTWYVYVKDGDVVKVEHSLSVISGYSYGSSEEHAKGDEGFEEAFKAAIRVMYVYNNEKYQKLVATLSPEVRDHYFEQQVIPK